MDDLIDSIALHGLRSAPPRRPRPEPLFCAFSRELTFADLEVLRTVPLQDSPTPQQRLRATHHALARLLAGGASDPDAAAATGHSVDRVRHLQRYDRGFIELVNHYKNVKDAEFVDVQARLALLGTAAAETLMERLEEDPERFTNKELMQLAEVTFDRSVAPAKGVGARGAGTGSAPPVSVSVTFVAPGGDVMAGPQASPMIEVQAVEESSSDD